MTIAGRRQFVGAVALSALVALSMSTLACHSGVQRTALQGGNAPDLATLPQSVSQLNDPNEMALPAVLLHQVRNNGSKYQQELVADGALTLNEYEKAELSYASCMEAAGYTLQPGSTELTGLARMDIAVGRFTGIAAEQKADTNCRGEYVSELEFPWAYLTAAIEQKVVAASRHFMANCVKSKHMTIAQAAEGPWGPTDPVLALQYQSCVASMEANYNIHTSFGVEGDDNYRPAGAGGGISDTPTPGAKH